MITVPSVVVDLIDAFRRSKAMFAAVSLGVFDSLHGQSLTAPSLAQSLKTDPASLERLLDGCVGLKLLSKTENLYANSPEADLYLRQASPDSLVGYIRYSDRVLWSLWANLDSAVREGTHRWDQTFGGRGALFANFFATDESKREF
ncbi:MAG: methyltransferase dimerization domain-containing protein, partial [Bryobacteraceae bacterium]